MPLAVAPSLLLIITNKPGASKPLGHWRRPALPLVAAPAELAGAIIRRRAGPVGWPPGLNDRKLRGGGLIVCAKRKSAPT